MLHSIQLEVAAELKARGCPLPVVYGPELQAGTFASQRIVFERDRDSGDGVEPPRKNTPNPNMVRIRPIAGIIRIYAQSTLEGANVYDHERVADQAVDQLLVALYDVIAKKKTLWRVTSAKLLTADELELFGLQTWPGVVYELRFTVDRGVYDRTWLTEAGVGGDASPEVKIGNDPGQVPIAATTTAVGPDGSSETVCEPSP